MKMSFLTHNLTDSLTDNLTPQTAITLMTALFLQESRAKFSKNVSRVLKAVDWPEGRKPNRPHSHHHHHQDASATPHQSQGMTLPYIKIAAKPRQSQGLLLPYINSSVFRDRSAVCQVDVDNGRTVANLLQRVVTAAVTPASACRGCQYALCTSFLLQMLSNKLRHPFSNWLPVPHQVESKMRLAPSVLTYVQEIKGGRTHLALSSTLGCKEGTPWTPLKGMMCPAVCGSYVTHMILTHGCRWA